MPNYTATAAEFEEELRRLVGQRDELDRQIANVTKALEAIQTLAQESREPLVVPPDLDSTPAGFTDRVRTVVSANYPRAVTAVEVRDALSDSGSDLKTMLIHVHNTLKRLQRQREVHASLGSDGRTAYVKAMESVGQIAERMLSEYPVITEAEAKRRK
jgi:hypothetical protein